MINRIRAFFSKDKYFYGFLIALILLLGQLPIILHILHTPKGFYYSLLDRVSFSDYYYLALIRFGMGPDWLLKIPYVTEAHKASLIQVFFVWLGKLSLLTGINPAEMLAIFRVLGGVVFIIAAVIIFRIILGKDKSRWAFLFFLLAQPLPYFDSTKYLWQDFDVWIWHFGEAARRLSAMPPHYTFGKGLAVLSLCFLFLYLKNKKIKYSLMALGLIFATGLIYPPPVFILCFSLVISLFSFYLLKWLVGHEKWKIGISGRVKNVAVILLYLLVAILSLLMLKLELNKGYPWSGWQKVELGWNDPKMHFEWDYLSIIWILVLLAIFSVGKVFDRKNITWLNLFLFFWAVSAFLLFPFADFLQVGKFRFTEGAQIVPLSILAYWGYEKLNEQIKTRLWRKLFFLAFIAYFLILSVCQVIWTTRRLWPYWANIYIKPEEVEALSFLEKNTKADSIILADTFSSNYIPAFARVRTIIGFPDAFNDINKFSAEESTINQILKGVLPQEKAADYIRNRRVEYIYYPIYTYGEKVLYPSLLKNIFKNKTIEIFRVAAD